MRLTIPFLAVLFACGPNHTGGSNGPAPQVPTNGPNGGHTAKSMTTYDSAGKITSQTTYSNGGLNEQTKEYGPDGKVVSTSDSIETSSADGRTHTVVRTSTDKSGISAKEKTVTAYDAQGAQIERQAFMSADDQNPYKDTKYTRDGSGRVLSEVVSDLRGTIITKVTVDYAKKTLHIDDGTTTTDKTFADEASMTYISLSSFGEIDEMATAGQQVKNGKTLTLAATCKDQGDTRSCKNSVKDAKGTVASTLDATYKKINFASLGERWMPTKIAFQKTDETGKSSARTSTTDYNAAGMPTHTTLTTDRPTMTVDQVMTYDDSGKLLLEFTTTVAAIKSRTVFVYE